MYKIKEFVEKDHPDCKILKYTIHFDENRPDGDVCIFLQRFRTLDHTMSGINTSQIRRWKKLGLIKDDFCVCLDDFYPNGRYFKERESYLRRGVGRNVLAEILSKVEVFNPKLIYAVPTNDTIKNFLASQGWKSDTLNQKRMYKLLF